MRHTTRWAVLGITVLLGACKATDAYRNDDVTVLPAGLAYQSLAAPQSDAERAALFIHTERRIRYSDDTWSSAEALQFTPLLDTTAVIDGHWVGALSNAAGQALYDASEAGLSVHQRSDTPLNFALLHAQDTPAARFYLLTQYAAVTRNEAEYQHPDVIQARAQAAEKAGRFPMLLSISTVQQNTNNGALEVSAHRPLDVSHLGGLWQGGGGTLSPWQTHLGGEAQEPDARAWLTRGTVQGQAAQPLEDFLRAYFDDASTYGDSAPYHYGYASETEVFDSGGAEVKKQYALGRFSHGGIAVMPDRQTVYMTDRATHGGLFMFIGSPGDLTAGTLYAARWEQTDASGAGAANLSWIQLGSAASAAIEALIFDSKLSFADIFEVSETAAEGFSAVKLGRGQIEYLRVKERMETAAAFLETRRYAALLGATLEFSGLSGLAVDAETNTLYLAARRVADGMRAESDHPQDHIQVDGDSDGAVYRLSLAEAQKDAQRKEINSAHVATTISPLADVNGADLYSELRARQPDSLVWSQKARILYIGAAPGQHSNVPLLAYDSRYRELTPLLYLPAGAAGGGLQMLEDANGYAYLLHSYQHAGLFPDAPERRAEFAAIQALMDNRQAEIGYIALPRLY